jgi:hypothetical protein
MLDTTTEITKLITSGTTEQGCSSLWRLGSQS